MKNKIRSIIVCLSIIFIGITSHAQTLEVRVYPHLVGYDNGEYLPNLEQLDTAKYVLNSIYNFHDIYFHYECPNIITSVDAINSTGSDVCGLGPYFHEDGIDMFLLPDETINGSPIFQKGFAHDIPGTAFYVRGINNVRDDCNLTPTDLDPSLTGNPFNREYLEHAYNGAFRNSIVAHEMGHCLGLLHTYTSSTATFSCTPHVIPSCIEFVNGNTYNRENCGDLISDTPADTGSGRECCEYVGMEVDFNGDPYDPMVENLMSTGDGFCRYKLTPGQIARIHQEMQGRPEIYRGPSDYFCDLSLCCNPLTNTVCLMDKTCTFNLTEYCAPDCNYEWIQPPLGLNGPHCVELIPGMEYSVRLFRGNFSKVIKFKTDGTLCSGEDAVSVRSIENTFDNTKLFPNPTTDLLHLDSSIEEIQYHLSDTNGKVILIGTIEESTIDLSTLQSGVYILTLSSEHVKENRIERIIKI